ncbi:putative cellulose monooxygenase [Penicillium oxalicum 114-2]|uniref:AA9 family lytic polysaccharide monooxygenase n=1 Tax=Penicillium oxalicum (strain 114-2 / CGMCC 5302) TaxID=933388 RepID=S7Z716_PENO1|nr:putative cellulose monooxygenase [Penicillium oxalicum 114-2]
MFKALATILLAELVAGHGHVSNIVVNGVSYQGWDIGSFPYLSNPPVVAAWGTPNTGNGFVTPSNFGSPDIICHQDAKNAKGHVVVAAGDKINLQWTTWPETHHGPVITYLADCGGSCETVDKTTLKFFKIDGVGLVDDSTPPGTWGDDQMIANGNSWMVEIPPKLAPGNYVLRHELIALHSAGSEDGAQNYPQCFNLQVTGSGSDKPSGVLGTELYRATDPGILVNIYQSLASYAIPGPAPYTGAVSIAQATSAITASGTPVTGSGAAPTTTAGGAGPGLGQSSTTTSSTTLITKTTTTTAPRTTTSSGSGSGSGGTQTVYGQCGGFSWSGPTACAAKATCTSYNPYYAQCVPTS